MRNLVAKRLIRVEGRDHLLTRIARAGGQPAVRQCLV